MSKRHLSWLLPGLERWLAARGRRSRGRTGERKVGEVLDQLAPTLGLRVQHRVRLGRRGDLDHALIFGRPTRFIIAIETKAERPAPSHLAQVHANARRASRQHFGAVPQYRIVVHPNSNEPVTYDVVTQAARMGLPRLPGYVRTVLGGRYADRLAR